MIGGVSSGFLAGMALWFFNEPISFTLFLSRRVGIDPSLVTGTLGNPEPIKE